MNVECSFTNASTADLSPGDVFYVVLKSQQSLGMILDKSPMGTSIAILQTETMDRPVPFWLTLRNQPRVLSLGGTCVIEPIFGPESVPGASYEHKSGPGVLTLDEAGALSMLLQPYDGAQNTPVSFDLRKNDYVHGISGYSISYFGSWRLWANREEMSIAGRRPLMEFSYKQFLR